MDGERELRCALHSQDLGASPPCHPRECPICALGRKPKAKLFLRPNPNSLTCSRPGSTGSHSKLTFVSEKRILGEHTVLGFGSIKRSSCGRCRVGLLPGRLQMGVTKRHI